MYKSKEQIDEENRIARNVDIVFVARQSGYNLKRIGGGACQFRDEANHLNFYPGTNSYYNYYENRGGSPIDLLINEEDMTLIQAINWLVDNSNEILTMDISSDAVSQKKKEKNIEMILPQKNNNHHRVYSYLTKSRRIDSEVVQKFLHLRTLYEDAEHHNCIFIGNDKDGNAKHGFVRGTLTDRTFKGDVPGSDKAYGFNYINKDSDKLLVFEAPIDLMSYMTLFPEQNYNMIALGMLCADPVDTFLKEHDGVKEIIFTLDVDQYGKDAAEQQINIYTEKGYSVRINPFCDDLVQSGVKDVNEYLVRYKTIEDKLLSGRSNNNDIKKL